MDWFILSLVIAVASTIAFPLVFRIKNGTSQRRRRRKKTIMVGHSTMVKGNLNGDEEVTIQGRIPNPKQIERELGQKTTSQINEHLPSADALEGPEPSPLPMLRPAEEGLTEDEDTPTDSPPREKPSFEPKKPEPLPPVSSPPPLRRIGDIYHEVAGRRRYSAAHIILALLVLVILVVGVIMLVIYWDSINKDKLFIGVGVYLLILIGMVAEAVMSAYLGGTEIRNIPAIHFISCFLMSPLVFLLVWNLSALGEVTATLYVAFLNGYFWKNVVSSAINRFQSQENVGG